VGGGGLKLFNNFRYVQQKAQGEKYIKPENKYFIIPALQKTLLKNKI
jgi:hypothetical protein